MAAVASPPQDTLVSQPQREVTYLAKRQELVLVHTPEYPIRTPEGRPVGLTEGVRIQFRDHMLRVPMEGTVTTAQGRQFPATELNEWLQRHPKFGDSWEGFTKIEQVAPPVTVEEMEAISSAAVMHDVDTLTAIIEQERAGWGRADVIRVAEQRVAQIDEVRRQIEAQMAIEAEAEKPKRGKASE
jgi:hypothetical protein